MLRVLCRIATVFALVGAIGLHWVAFQSVAWAMMIVDYSKHAPLRQAIAQTFDGAHPCSLCHAVSKGRSSEKKSDRQAGTSKIDLICSTQLVRLMPRSTPFDYLAATFSLLDREHSPPVPPPRHLGFNYLLLG
jgi:hypothetical protein